MEPLKILYEDAHLVICCKPVGVLSEDSESGRCMPQLLREHYLAQGQKNPYIATVHRLDKITGGGHGVLPAAGGHRKTHRRCAGP